MMPEQLIVSHMPAPQEDRSFTRTTKVIAVADVVESVRLMEQDEQEFIRRWQRFVGFVQQRLPSESGRLHKSLGDGLMLEFSDPDGCIRAALAMRAWFAAANEGLSPEDQVHLRIGAHMAEFIADEHDIYGTDVNLAARMASLAGPGEIVISASLREHLGAGFQGELEDLGSCHLKHVKDPVHAFRMGQAGRAPVLPVRRLAGHTLRPSIAVLPFAVQGKSPDSLTGEALADDIVAELSRSEQLQVASRISTSNFDAAHAQLEEVRRVVGAHFVLSGRGRRDGGDLSLFVELADAVTGRVAWAQSFHGPLRKAGFSDGHLMRAIVSALHSAVIAHEVQRARGQPLPALEGFTLLLGAIGQMHWLSGAEMERARGMLEHLVERARGHAAPHAWLAHLHVLRLRQGGARRFAADAQLALERAADAVQCDPGSPLALSMQGQAGLYARADSDAAEERYAQALTAKPEDSLALLLRGELRALQGDGTTALGWAQRACETVPLEGLRCLYDTVCATAAVVAGEPARAVLLAQGAVERNPEFLPAWRVLVVAQVRAGELSKARRSAQRWSARQPGMSLEGVMAALPACAEVSRLFADALAQAGIPTP